MPSANWTTRLLADYLAALEAAARDHFRHLAAHPAEVLAQIGSPGCLLEVAHEPLALAA